MTRSRWRVGVLAMTLVGVVAACAGAPPPQLGSGLLLSGYDRKVRVQDDLFRFANGQWLRTTAIPADRASYSAFTAVADQADQNLRTIVQDSAARHGAAGSPDQQIGDFYASFMDTARLDALGITPLKASLDRIDALTSPADLLRYFAETARTGSSSPIALSVDQDAKNASAYLPDVTQSGLTLPNRDYYLKTDPQFVTIRDQLRAYVARMLGLAGVAAPDAAAGQVLAVENRLAEAQWTAVQNRDATATYNKFTVADATARTPGLDWKTYLDAAGVHTPDFVVAEPGFFTALGTALTTVPPADWRSYLKFRLIDDLAPYLSNDFVTARFEFRGRDLAGQQEMSPRWKRGVTAVNSAMGDLLGRRYVQRYFPPDAKRRVDALVGRLIDAYRSSIDGLDWMSAATRAQAEDKLGKLDVKIGYPSEWKDYSKLRVARDDLVGNEVRASALEYQRDLDRLGKPVDRAEWFTTPQTVNAFYNPTRNDITFPAAILQPPFFDPTADDAVNYGGIGAVIGHEISHAFDDQGRKYDGTGNLRDWWTPQDVQRFTARTTALAAQYSAYEPLPGEHVNGELTLGENIADLSGLTVALRAYRLSLGGRGASVMNGFTGEQRFFLGWAQVWRGKTRNEDLRVQLLSDPHSPDEFRANGVVSNLPEYYTAFDVKQGDKLFRPPGQRVRIW
ncbi:MAG: M13 family metallopeptidase [Pseudonocardiales bacterium]|nr:M13 family metallopeptidase [Pseudonocardiales bacterium]MBV9029235.1 M13 family metallopeptidase [Pseudonocardiales bacterium]